MASVNLKESDLKGKEKTESLIIKEISKAHANLTRNKNKKP